MAKSKRRRNQAVVLGREADGGGDGNQPDQPAPTRQPAPSIFVPLDEEGPPAPGPQPVLRHDPLGLSRDELRDQLGRASLSPTSGYRRILNAFDAFESARGEEARTEALETLQARLDDWLRSREGREHTRDPAKRSAFTDLQGRIQATQALEEAWSAVNALPPAPTPEAVTTLADQVSALANQANTVPGQGLPADRFSPLREGLERLHGNLAARRDLPRAVLDRLDDARRNVRDHEVNAEARAGQLRPTGGGASASFFVRDADNRNALVFKTKRGEQLRLDDRGLDDSGQGVLGELLTARLAEELNRQAAPSGFSVAVPETRLGELSGAPGVNHDDNHQGAVGTLQRVWAGVRGGLDGWTRARVRQLPGRELSLGDGVASVDTAAHMLTLTAHPLRQPGRILAEGDSLGGPSAVEDFAFREDSVTMHLVPPPGVDAASLQRDLEAIAILDLLTLQLDRNPGNMLHTDEDGTTRLRLIDNADSLPGLQRAISAMSNTRTFEGNLGTWRALEGADRPLSREALDTLLSLDPEAITEALRRESERIHEQSGQRIPRITPDQLLIQRFAVEALQRAARSEHADRLTPAALSRLFYSAARPHTPDDAPRQRSPFVRFLDRVQEAVAGPDQDAPDSSGSLDDAAAEQLRQIYADAFEAEFGDPAPGSPGLASELAQAVKPDWQVRSDRVRQGVQAARLDARRQQHYSAVLARAEARFQAGDVQGGQHRLAWLEDHLERQLRRDAPQGERSRLERVEAVNAQLDQLLQQGGPDLGDAIRQVRQAAREARAARNTDLELAVLTDGLAALRRRLEPAAPAN